MSYQRSQNFVVGAVYGLGSGDDVGHQLMQISGPAAALSKQAVNFASAIRCRGVAVKE